jgi:hypothetical protein
VSLYILAPYENAPENYFTLKIYFGLRNYPPHGIGGQEGFLANSVCETCIISKKSFNEHSIRFSFGQQPIKNRRSAAGSQLALPIPVKALSSSVGHIVDNHP